MYGLIQRLLNEEYNVQDTVLIESPFKEKTRKGRYCGTVILAITPDNLIIASGKSGKSKRLAKGPTIRVTDLRSLYPLSSVKFTVFKRTHKQTIKVTFKNNNITRYFELERMDKRKIFWKLWCLHIDEISRGKKLWPYLTNSFKCCLRNRWTDKDLYLGSVRHAEDQDRPIPIPGLGSTEENKLLYLKPEYFGCWDQTEHWVHCDEVLETTCDYDVFTYTGVPTSNITYTSLTTTLKMLGKQNNW